MGAIRSMMATSLDGFAADAAGGVGWLAPFEAVDWGYGDFIAEIGTVVLGRRTYEQLPSLAPEWPYPGQAGIVVGQVTPPLWGGASRWEGDLPALAQRLRAQPKDAWIVGGPMLQGAFLTLGLMDRLQLCVVPHLLGKGVRLFPETPPVRAPQLTGVQTLPLGMVMLDYRFT